MRERGVGGAAPLINRASGDVAGALPTITGAHFALGASVAVPSYDLHGAAFDPYRYWRGPAWFNVNWMLERGLRLTARLERADELRTNVLAAAASSRFAENLDPYTGAGARSPRLQLDRGARPGSPAPAGVHIRVRGRDLIR